MFGWFESHFLMDSNPFSGTALIMNSIMSKWIIVTLPGWRKIRFVVDFHDHKSCAVSFVDEKGDTIEIPDGVTLKDSWNFRSDPIANLVFLLNGKKDYEFAVDGKVVASFVDFHNDSGHYTIRHGTEGRLRIYKMVTDEE